MSGDLVLVGCLKSGLDLAERLIANGVEFAQVVTVHPDNVAVSQISGYFDYTAFALRHEIPIYYVRDYGMKHEEDVEFFQEHGFDLLIQGGWQRLFPKAVLDTLKVGAIGVHGSADFLPRGRGRSPMNWSILEGRDRFILALFFIQPGADDGAVFDFESYDINSHDTIQTLYYKSVLATEKMIIRNLKSLLEGRVTPIEQSGTPSYFPKRSPRDGRIDWEESDVYAVHRAIRAQTRPYPGAFAQINGQWSRIWSAQVFDTRLVFPGQPYGAVVAQFGSDLIVNCLGGLLLVTEFETISELEFPELGIEA